MSLVFVVTSDQGAAHEPDLAYSVWSTPELAERERQRMQALEDTSGGSSHWHFGVTAVTVDQPSVDSAPIEHNREAAR
jgi:hypothetical protein